MATLYLIIWRARWFSKVTAPFYVSPAMYAGLWFITLSPTLFAADFLIIAILRHGKWDLMALLFISLMTRYMKYFFSTVSHLNLYCSFFLLILCLVWSFFLCAKMEGYVIDLWSSFSIKTAFTAIKFPLSTAVVGSHKLWYAASSLIWKYFLWGKIFG